MLIELCFYNISLMVSFGIERKSLKVMRFVTVIVNIRGCLGFILYGLYLGLLLYYVEPEDGYFYLSHWFLIFTLFFVVETGNLHSKVKTNM